MRYEVVRTNDGPYIKWAVFDSDKHSLFYVGKSKFCCKRMAHKMNAVEKLNRELLVQVKGV